MILALDAVLSSAETAELKAAVLAETWVDGRTTAGWHARTVKNNDQLDRDTPGAEDLKARVADAMRRSPAFRSAVLPAGMSVLFNRYGPGQAYGAHIDNAFMGGMRTDVAFTLFLSAPEDYEGGELVIDLSGVEQRVKLPAGAAIVYPATTLHRVETVMRGERVCAVGWVESRVRDAGQRETLYDLDRAKAAMFEAAGKTEAFDLVSKAYANLLRRWGG
jgi:PKHD-type hydroxylase